MRIFHGIHFESFLLGKGKDVEVDTLSMIKKSLAILTEPHLRVLILNISKNKRIRFRNKGWMAYRKS